MSNRHKKRFKVYNDELGEGRAKRAMQRRYKTAEISAGTILGIEPDTIYFRIDKDEMKRIMFYVTPLEAMDIITVLSSALWNESARDKTLMQEQKPTKRFYEFSNSF